MKQLMILVSMIGLITSCQSQEKQNDTIANSHVEKRQEPNESWTVNKELDENGNIIRYDSIYSWSSSSNGQLMTGRNIDSIMKSFTGQFQQGLPGNSNSFIEDFFNGTMSEQDDFFSEFFAQDSISNTSRIDAIRKQIQAMHQQLMQDMRQPLIPAAPQETETEKKSDKKSL